jgi:soluble lytic murein transglycosylase-like protein
VSLQVSDELYFRVEFYSKRSQVPPALVLAIMAQESGFDPLAIGDGGESFGLMQLNRAGAGAGYPGSQLLDLDVNINLGCNFLAWCINQTPDIPAAVSAIVCMVSS